MTGKKQIAHPTMVGLNVIFSKLDKFTGIGDVDLNLWLRNFEHCCAIAEKTDKLVLGQLLILCVDGRAKATLDYSEEEKSEPQILKTSKNNLLIFLTHQPTAKPRCHSLKPASNKLAK